MTQRLAAIKALSVSTSGLNDSALALFLKEKTAVSSLLLMRPFSRKR